jgi:hypothetical protein
LDHASVFLGPWVKKLDSKALVGQGTGMGVKEEKGERRREMVYKGKRGRYVVDNRVWRWVSPLVKKKIHMEYHRRYYTYYHISRSIAG